MEKNCVIFGSKKLFFSFFGLYLDLDFKFLKPFGLWLNLDWDFKIQDWIWIAKYDSPLIFGEQAVFARTAWINPALKV